MNNEPVAWLWVHKGTTMNALLRNPMSDEYGKKHFEPKGWSSIPLYTHPVKELTDEEIIQSAKKAGVIFDERYKGEITFISKEALKRFVDEIFNKES